MTNIASATQVAAIIKEFGEDGICAFVSPEDGARCLRAAGQCEEMKNIHNPHDDCIPMGEALEEMRRWRNRPTSS